MEGKRLPLLYPRAASVFYLFKSSSSNHRKLALERSVGCWRNGQQGVTAFCDYDVSASAKWRLSA